MCRLLGYLGKPIQLSQILYQPEHSLIVQSYQPWEMTSGVVNADGFGIGWYHSQRETEPFTYKHILPAWSDVNLPQLSRYIESGCILANVRSATAGQAVDLSNCQPFAYQRLLFVHNGFIQNFRQSLYRPLRDRLSDMAYQLIGGSTDSEHIFALLIDTWQASPNITLEQALEKTLRTLHGLASKHQVKASANIVITEGHRLIASRFCTHSPAPTLYWLKDDRTYPGSIMMASEPLLVGEWIRCTENSILTIGEDCEPDIHPIL
ncbi:MAG: ergothioneine biosynthesis protein EgtC [Hormoscilla sp. GM102CHS1]|nr:ergothioneine biosynthesis protein EgtC [Hormoscilla sp. GM102CHS1]